jgi:hypothetical protein
MPRWAASIVMAALPRKRRRVRVGVCNIGGIVLLLASILIAWAATAIAGDGGPGFR